MLKNCRSYANTRCTLMLMTNAGVLDDAPVLEGTWEKTPFPTRTTVHVPAECMHQMHPYYSCLHGTFTVHACRRRPAK
jgi:hypothetical protein